MSGMNPAGYRAMAVDLPAAVPEGKSDAPAASRWRRCLTPWRSPAGQPAWARPALLAIAAVAAVAYGWGTAGDEVSVTIESIGTLTNHVTVRD